MGQADSIAAGVVQRLSDRSYEESPELRDPPPLTPTEVSAYSAWAAGLPYSELVKSMDLMAQTSEAIKASLPPERLDLLAYPHPVLQRQVVLLNEFYRRSVETPVIVSRYNVTKTTLEWGLAGGLAGGVLGYFMLDKHVLSGAVVGCALGALAGRSDIVQRLFIGLASNIAAL